MFLEAAPHGQGALFPAPKKQDGKGAPTLVPALSWTGTRVLLFFVTEKDCICRLYGIASLRIPLVVAVGVVCIRRVLLRTVLHGEANRTGDLAVPAGSCNTWAACEWTKKNRTADDNADETVGRKRATLDSSESVTMHAEDGDTPRDTVNCLQDPVHQNFSESADSRSEHPVFPSTQGCNDKGSAGAVHTRRSRGIATPLTIQKSEPGETSAA